jgi:hypothetical protein
MKRAKALVTLATTNGGSYVVENFSIVTKDDVIDFTRTVKSVSGYEKLIIAIQNVISNNDYYVKGYECFGTTMLDIFIRIRNEEGGYSRIPAHPCGAKCWKVVK